MSLFSSLMARRHRSGRKSPVIVKGMDRSRRNEFEMVAQTEDDSEKLAMRSCILCLGSKGSGKTTVMNSVCGRQVAQGQASTNDDDAEEEFSLTLHAPNWPQENCFWIETHFKWDERRFDVERIVEKMLLFMENQDISRIRCILWTVSPNYDARDVSLLRQAEVINFLKKGDVWQHVIVVCKYSNVPERDGSNALKAVERLSPGHHGTDVVGLNQVDGDAEAVQALRQKIAGRHGGLTVFSKSAKDDDGDGDNSPGPPIGVDRSVYDFDYPRRNFKPVFGIPPMILSKPF